MKQQFPNKLKCFGPQNCGYHKIRCRLCGELVCNVNIIAHTSLPHNTQTSVPPAGFEPAIAASDRPQTDALDHAATGDGLWMCG